MIALFDRAFAILMTNEGGFVNDARDKGGATKFGISQARYPGVDISGLTQEDAKRIYRRDYWDKYYCGQMPDAIALVFFDCVVNHSPLNPIRWLQTAVNCYPDGSIGNRTLGAARACSDPVKAARDITLLRIEYVKHLENYDRFGAGWHRRHVVTLVEAIRA